MKKYDNFCAAFENLKELYNYNEPYDTVILTGLVGLYEICFEQSWKMMKEILASHGYEASATGSPKTILKTAFKAGMIDDENLWLEALEARNNVSHAYNRDIANYIVKQAKDKFYNMFKKLKDESDIVSSKLFKSFGVSLSDVFSIKNIVATSSVIHPA